VNDVAKKPTSQRFVTVADKLSAEVSHARPCSYSGSQNVLLLYKVNRACARRQLESGVTHASHEVVTHRLSHDRVTCHVFRCHSVSHGRLGSMRTPDIITTAPV